jgi:hypothetical protein
LEKEYFKFVAKQEVDLSEVNSFGPVADLL